jgi:hypothetical protein
MINSSNLNSSNGKPLEVPEYTYSSLNRRGIFRYQGGNTSHVYWHYNRDAKKGQNIYVKRGTRNDVADINDIKKNYQTEAEKVRFERAMQNVPLIPLRGGCKISINQEEFDKKTAIEKSMINRFIEEINSLIDMEEKARRGEKVTFVSMDEGAPFDYSISSKPKQSVLEILNERLEKSEYKITTKEGKPLKMPTIDLDSKKEISKENGSYAEYNFDITGEGKPAKVGIFQAPDFTDNFMKSKEEFLSFLRNMPHIKEVKYADSLIFGCHKGASRSMMGATHYVATALFKEGLYSDYKTALVETGKTLISNRFVDVEDFIRDTYMGMHVKVLFLEPCVLEIKESFDRINETLKGFKLEEGSPSYAFLKNYLENPSDIKMAEALRRHIQPEDRRKGKKAFENNGEIATPENITLDYLNQKVYLLEEKLAKNPSLECQAEIESLKNTILNLETFVDYIDLKALSASDYEKYAVEALEMHANVLKENSQNSSKIGDITLSRNNEVESVSRIEHSENNDSKLKEEMIIKDEMINNERNTER